MPRKSYRDDFFPNVPDEYLADFVRGNLDGDGCVCIVKENAFCGVDFLGQRRFIYKLRNKLVRMAELTKKEPFQGVGCWCVSWSANADIRKLRAFLYPEGYEFCYERKRNLFDKWLSVPHKEMTTKRPWTEEELQKVKDLYNVLGPTKLAAEMGRDYSTLLYQVDKLGLKRIRKKWKKNNGHSTE